MIPELLASAVMLRRALADDEFVRAASSPAPDGAPAYARMVRGAAASALTGLAVPAVALTAFPLALGLPLATASLLIVTCDWLLSFCGARVRMSQSDMGTSFRRIPVLERGVLAAAAVPFASLLAASAFAWFAFHPPSF